MTTGFASKRGGRSAKEICHEQCTADAKGNRRVAGRQYRADLRSGGRFHPDAPARGPRHRRWRPRPRHQSHELDFEVQRAAKEKPTDTAYGGATLLPASETTRKEPEFEPSEKQRDDLNVDAVFAKLKTIGGKKPDQE